MAKIFKEMKYFLIYILYTFHRVNLDIMPFDSNKIHAMFFTMKAAI